MALRTRLTSVVVGCACVAALAACGSSADPGEDEYVDGEGITVSVQPQLVAPGDSAAAADDAGYVMTAVVEGVGTGHEVGLQTWTDDGWRNDQSAATLSDGSVSFRTKTSAWSRLVTEVDGAARAAHVYPSDGPAVVWTDDFDADGLNPLWVSIDQPDLGYTCSDGDARAAEVSEGLLRLSVATSPDVECALTGQTGRVNGHVALELPFFYGTAAARIRMPKSRDLQGAWWLQDAGAARPWVMNARAEGAVIAETNSTDQERHIDTAVPYVSSEGLFHRGTKHATRPPGVATDGQFHVFSVDWTPESYVFRIDGEVVRRANKGVQDQPLTLALALLSPDTKPPSRAALRDTMDIDWLRIWAQPVTAPAPAAG